MKRKMIKSLIAFAIIGAFHSPKMPAAAFEELTKITAGTSSNVREDTQPFDFHVYTMMADGQAYEYDQEIPKEGTLRISWESDRPVDVYYKADRLSGEKALALHHQRPHKNGGLETQPLSQEWVLVPAEEYIEISQTLHCSYRFRAVDKENHKNVAVTDVIKVNTIRLSYYPVSIGVFTEEGRLIGPWTNQDIQIRVSGGLADQEMKYLKGYEYRLIMAGLLQEEAGAWTYLDYDGGSETSIQLDEEMNLSRLLIRPVSIFEGRGPETEGDRLIGIDKQGPKHLWMDYRNGEIREVDENYPLMIFGGERKIGLLSQDEASGIEGFFYQLEYQDGRVIPGWTKAVRADGCYRAEVTVSKDFCGRLAISFQDRAGNWFRDGMPVYDGAFVIEITRPKAPEIALLSSGEVYHGEWTKQDIEILIRDTTAFTGAAFYQYVKTDGRVPSDACVWQDIGRIQADPEPAGGNNPFHSPEERLDISADCNDYFFFRTISHGGLIGEISRGYEVKVQKTLPENTEIFVQGAGRGSWYREVPEIQIQEIAADGETIACSVYYRIWPAGSREPDEAVCFQENGSITGYHPVIQEEGCYFLRVWTEDAAGNRSLHEQDLYEEINVDLTAPQIAVMYADGSDGLFYNQGRTCIIQITEEHLSEKEVRILYLEGREEKLGRGVRDEDGRYVYQIDFMQKAELFSDQRYDFTVQVSDLAGNTVVSKPQRFIIDMRVPSVDTVAVQPDKPSWVRDAALEVQAGASGLRSVKLLKDENLAQVLFTDGSADFDENSHVLSQAVAFSIFENGSYTLAVESKSGICNRVFLGDYQQIDHLRPVIKIDRNGYEPGKWTSQRVVLEVENLTANLGDTAYYYRVDQNGEWEAFDGILRISEDNEATYYFMAESEAQRQARLEAGITAKNNVEYRQSICGEKMISVKVDESYPENLKVEYHYKEAPAFLNTLPFRFFFKDSLTVDLSAEDDMSGIKYFDVLLQSVDGQVEEKRIYPDNPGSGLARVSFQVTPQFVGTLFVSATDHAGLSVPKNGMSRYASFAVDSQAPTRPSIDGGDYRFGEWVNQDIRLRVEGAIAESGISRYEYTVTQGDWPEEEAAWYGLLPVEQAAGNSLYPNHVLTAGMILTEDTDAVFFFRGVSNSGLKGQVVQQEVKLQKSRPQPPEIVVDKGNANGWYDYIPDIHLLSPPGKVPVRYHYELTESSARTPVMGGVFLGEDGPRLLNDGEYLLRAWAEDAAGNRSCEELDSITEIKVDMTAPVLEIAVNGRVLKEDGFYHSDVKLTVDIDETNLRQSGVEVMVQMEDGAKLPLNRKAAPGRMSYSAALSREGCYTLTAMAADLAGNQTPLYERQITIDKRPPLILVEGVMKRSANNLPVQPQVTILDKNLDYTKSVIRLIRSDKKEDDKEIQLEKHDGYGRAGFDLLDQDGLYSFRIEAWDQAGNYSEDTYVFSVNQTGPVLAFRPEEHIGSYVNKPFRPWIEIWDIDPVTVLSLTVNGRETPFHFQEGRVLLEDEIRKEGKYVIGLEVMDSAGNHKMMDAVEFYYDDTPPEMIVTGVESGQYYHKEAVVTLMLDSPEDFITEIKINGTILAPGDYLYDESGSILIRLTEPGSYVLDVSAEDKAGNRTDLNSITFSIGNKWMHKWKNWLFKNFLDYLLLLSDYI